MPDRWVVKDKADREAVGSRYREALRAGGEGERGGGLIARAPQTPAGGRGEVKYVCLACGRSFEYLSAWYQHLIRCHPELEPDWARSMRLLITPRETRREQMKATLRDARNSHTLSNIAVYDT
jgi:hypothetical protein